VTASLWIIRLPVNYRIEDTHLSWLDDAEYDLAASFTAKQDRDTYLAARVWLRKVLSNELGMAPNELRFNHDTFGASIVVTNASSRRAQSINFCLSYTTNGIACVICHECKIGVDIERIVPIAQLSTIAANTLHPSEVRRFIETREDGRLLHFYRLWVAKESLLKAIGVNMDISPSCLGFMESYDGQWHLSDYPTGTIGRISSGTHVGQIASSPAHPRCEYIYAISMLAPLATITVHDVRCSSSIANIRLDHHSSFIIKVGQSTNLLAH
jgi:4'-phosphopantetheinyl transferase